MLSHRTIVAIATIASVAPLAAQAPRHVDVLIRGGTLVDGSGGKERSADVGISGDRIVFVGDAAKSRLTSARTIDAKGLVIAPGFIDPHTHTLEDLSDSAHKSNLPYLFQGVTTVVTGNDGSSATRIGPTLQRWDAQGIGTNALLYVGQGTVRHQVLGMSDAAPTPAQLDSMRALVRQAMQEGAFGMSTGLYYAPGSYAKTEEVIELAKVAAAAGGIYDSHLRDESSYTIGLLGAVDEALRIGREAHIPIHISHIKALGTDVWGQSTQVIEHVKRAQAQGVAVSADQYPYTASGSSVGASLLPRWAEAGGRDSLLARIADSATHVRLVSEMTNNLRRRGGPASLLITSSRDSTIKGKTLEQIAQARGVSPIDAALGIIQAGGDAGVASFNMNEKDIETFMKQDFVSTGSDGSTGHPRKYGTFPRKLREYVYTRHIITLPFAVQHSGALTAKALHIPDRGMVKKGYFADVIVFDPVTIADKATYEQPELLATGMRYVLVNGQLAIDDGKYTGALAGHALRRPATTKPAARPVMRKAKG